MLDNEINAACFWAEGRIGEGKHRGFALIVTKYGMGMLAGPIAGSKPSISNRVFTEFTDDYKLPSNPDRKRPLNLEPIHKTATYKRLLITLTKKFETRPVFDGHNFDEFINRRAALFRQLEDEEIAKSVLLKLQGYYEQNNIIQKAIKLEQRKQAEAMKHYEAQADWGIF